MRDKDSSKSVFSIIFTDASRGFGFITFKDPHALDDVLQMTPHIIDGK
jgi:hypothetical protein